MTAPTCARDGAAILRVERLTDFATERRRIVFACGHDQYVSPPAVERVTGPVCTYCAEPKAVDGHRRCGNCRCCVCGRRPYGHRASACPKLRLVAA